MIETLEVIAIFAACGFLTWSAMKKYGSQIERRLDEIDIHSTELITERKLRK